MRRLSNVFIEHEILTRNNNNYRKKKCKTKEKIRFLKKRALPGDDMSRHSKKPIKSL